jgi:succinylglutamate desuccinylase
MDQAATDPVQAFAEGDFSQIADSFANAGFAVRLPARGILQLGAPGRFLKRARLLVSAGVHGDETAPIEMMAQLLAELARTPSALAVDLMVAIGNPAAIAQGKRYIDGDLNRMFTVERGALQSTAEAERADIIMRATANFFGGQDADKWHFDLHTAIRSSHYPTFAVVPDVIAPTRKQSLLGWLGRAGIGAAILNTRPAGTFSAYTAHMFGAASATVELGQVGKLGSNDLSRFVDARSALDGFLRTGRAPVAEVLPHVFKVAQELVKHTEGFRMAFGEDTQNFTAMEPGTTLAEDGDVVYRVGNETEYVVFPTPGVRPGLRAGLMVVRAAV